MHANEMLTWYVICVYIVCFGCRWLSGVPATHDVLLTGGGAGKRVLLAGGGALHSSTSTLLRHNTGKPCGQRASLFTNNKKEVAA
jgi:hypothetical protein